MHEKLSHIVITNIESIFTLTRPTNHKKLIQNRFNYGLSFCTEGQCTYTHNGIEYETSPNQAIILPQAQSYMIHVKKHSTFLLINFECKDMLCDTPILIPIENPVSFIKDYEQMRSLSFFNGNRLKMLSIFYNILSRLEDSSHTPILLPALKFIKENYQNPNLTNTELAKQCNISEVYFRRLFTQQYQTTPKQFIIDTRINKAKQLLAEGNMKIHAVSEQCGFSNPYHFCRTFKAQIGMTPTEYLTQNRVMKI